MWVERSLIEAMGFALFAEMFYVTGEEVEFCGDERGSAELQCQGTGFLVTVFVGKSQRKARPECAARDAIIPLVLKGTKGKLDYDGRKSGLSSKGC